MGRLFWKFFFAFLLAQSLAGGALLLTVMLIHDTWDDRPGQGAPLVQEMAHWEELDPLSALEQAGPPSDTGNPPPPPPAHGPPPPYLPLVTIFVGCLAASALLAWYFARPVRNLRWALGAVAAGRLDTRLQPKPGGWRDEIGDLGLEFDRMAQELQRLVDSQRQLLHDVSHELRSPLARLQAAIGLARQDPSRVERAFDRIERESQRLATLVGELLTLARLESGRGEAPKTPVEVVELIAGVAEDARFEARSTGRDLSFSGGGDFILMGHAEQLHRAFENVLRNAVKYTDRHTCVEVTLERTASDALCVRVCDQGPGVSGHELEAIFQPFHRTREEEADGFGLGLAIARHAIQAHQGSIRALRRGQGGLCIEIRLPGI